VFLNILNPMKYGVFTNAFKNIKPIRKRKSGLLALAALLLCFGQSYGGGLKPGYWHTRMQLAEGVILPINIRYEKSKTGPVLVIINGEEQIHLSQVKILNDSMFVQFQAFSSELKIKVHSKHHLTGAWFNYAKSGNYNIPFSSDFNSGPAYPFISEHIGVEGKWEVTFDYDKEPEKAIGLFNYQQNTQIRNNNVYGTFLTETGDYRYLHGATVSDSLYLSTFDGSHAFLFRAQLKNDTLWGDFHSGKHYHSSWYAVKNEAFELTHPDSLTFVVNEKPLEFDLVKLDGSNYHYPNEEVKNKVVLIQIMGTWCPNCMDESNYLKGVDDRHANDIEIIAVTFETQKTQEGKIEKVKKYKDALGLHYTFLIGGDACKSCAAGIFPQLNNIISFPTLIFIDKKGEIRKIHTGFSGPGTGDYYTSFVVETDAFIASLVNE
jgi:thiol-disulfide isomerase/thioredoxin